MFTQYATQPQLFPHFDWRRADRLLVVSIASNRIPQGVGQTASHSRAEVHSRWSQNHGHTCGHVFATVLTNAFDHGECTAIPDRESFAHPARDVEFATGRTVQQSVTRKHVAPQRGFFPACNRNRTAGQTFADVIVGLADEPEVQSLGEKSAKSLPRTADKLIFRSRISWRPRLAQYLSAQISSDCAIGVSDTETSTSNHPI